MDHKELQDHIDKRFDRVHVDVMSIHEKIDNHLERLSKAEEAIVWIKGHIRIGVMLVVAALTGLASAIYNLM